MGKEVIQIGDKIEMIHLKNNLGVSVSPRKYVSQLLEFQDNNDVKVSMPILEGKIIPLEIGDEYLLCFFTSQGLYQCKAKIVSRTQERNMYILIVNMLSVLKKYQRRKYYRLDCLIPIKQREVTRAEQILMERLQADNFDKNEEKLTCLAELEKLPKEWMEANVSDISGGGIRFHGKKRWESSELIELYIPVALESGIIPIKVFAKVISCSFFEESRMQFEIRAEFVDITDNDREYIIKFVFEEQRRRLRKD